MNANVPSILEPLYKHLQTIFRELVPKSRGFSILVTEIRGSVVFSLSASIRFSTGRKSDLASLFQRHVQD
ncbi:hypothetical protein PHLCEN_2v2556 [Hermanssonia centrifuga]|uniref:Uncharacterized protein n=1 Tax=Hermanssonia centrifuga TaxID=98765 RepID=A0A2R6RLN3_9APHY|nr:hypothetical protein PHLCEN_2v2556 [Hermanssonia centrifuga]